MQLIFNNCLQGSCEHYEIFGQSLAFLLVATGVPCSVVSFKIGISLSLMFGSVVQSMTHILAQKRMTDTSNYDNNADTVCLIKTGVVELLGCGYHHSLGDGSC